MTQLSGIVNLRFCGSGAGVRLGDVKLTVPFVQHARARVARLAEDREVCVLYRIPILDVEVPESLEQVTVLLKPVSVDMAWYGTGLGGPVTVAPAPRVSAWSNAAPRPEVGAGAWFSEDVLLGRGIRIGGRQIVACMHVGDLVVCGDGSKKGPSLVDEGIA